MDFNAVNERICVIRIREKFFNITLISVHAPTNEADENDKDAFYDNLEEIYRKVPDHDAKIVLGDFNAKIGREICFRPVIGIHSLHEESNANGLGVIDFASGKNMTVSSTYFKHKDIHKMTWCSPDGVTRNQIDHLLIDKRHGTDILDVRSYRGADCDTDHYLVKIKYRQRINNMKKFRGVSQKKFDSEKLIKDEELRERDSQKLVEKIERMQGGESVSVEEQWKNIKQVVTESAQETIGYKKQDKRNVWMDDECLKALECGQNENDKSQNKSYYSNFPRETEICQ
ncbi:craniofacial development protein 2-like [Nilaparvata lugens]|uniref:craniofacial development protein 2-like n=1 Tax=Nilaparvata lugens TaxID=108931 RepID=UPI00193EA77D|nr:craniofacial development protein 2-like [Nilaparvata lugens]